MEHYEITVKGTAGEIGAIKDCLAVTYTPQSCMTIEAVETKLELAYDGPTEAAVQETIPVSLTISNPGNRAVADVEIQFSLPEGLVTAAGNTRILGKVGTLGAGEKKIMRISLKVQEAGTYENEVTATGAGGLEAKVSFTLTVK